MVFTVACDPVKAAMIKHKLEGEISSYIYMGMAHDLILKFPPRKTHRVLAILMINGIHMYGETVDSIAAVN